MISGLSVSLIYAVSIDLFSDAFGPRGAKLQHQTDEHFRKKISKFNPLLTLSWNFFYIRF